jgi:hypothetical protein
MTNCNKNIDQRVLYILDSLVIATSIFATGRDTKSGDQNPSSVRCARSEISVPNGKLSRGWRRINLH